MHNKNIILFQPLKKLPSQSNSAEPLAVESLASVIEEEGFSSFILPTCASNSDLICLIEKTKPLALGLSAYSYTYNDCLNYAQTAKKTAKKIGYNLHVVFGGYHSTAFPEETASQPNIDYVVIGEGEATFKELIIALFNNQSPEKIKGLCFVKNSSLIKTSPRPRIKDLDKLPFLKRNLKILKKAKSHFRAIPLANTKKNPTYVYYSRGCYYDCYFCQKKNLLGNEVHWRSPKKVLDEIELLIKKFNSNIIIFSDSALNLNKEKLLSLCTEFIKRDLPVYWVCNIKIDILDEEQLLAMEAAKCIKIAIGIESPILKHAKNLKKHHKITQREIIKILNFANNLGFIIRIYSIIGFPYETKNLLKTYLKKLKTLPFDELLLSFATPLPKTDFYFDCIKNGSLTEPIDWKIFHNEEPCLKNPNITREEYIAFGRKIYTDIYSSAAHINRAKRKLKKFPFLAKSYLNFITFLNSFDLIKDFEKKYKDLF